MFEEHGKVIEAAPEVNTKINNVACIAKKRHALRLFMGVSIDV